MNYVTITKFFFAIRLSLELAFCNHTPLLNLLLSFWSIKDTRHLRSRRRHLLPLDSVLPGLGGLRIALTMFNKKIDNKNGWYRFKRSVLELHNTHKVRARLHTTKKRGSCGCNKSATRSSNKSRAQMVPPQAKHNQQYNKHETKTNSDVFVHWCSPKKSAQPRLQRAIKNAPRCALPFR